jgi:ABC-type lipoprotein release transport system permease subunit
MNSLFKMASRNIWRNKARTLITAAAVTFGVFLSILLNSFQSGSWDTIINGIVQGYYGYAQVQGKGYWNEQSLDNSFEYTPELQKIVTKTESVKAVVPRLEGFVLAAFESSTKPIQIVGTNPTAENAMTHIADSLKAGKYLSQNDDGILISDTLAQEMNLSINDTLVFIGQGFHGANAAGKYPIRGIVKFKMPQMRGMVFMTLANAQTLFVAENRLTALVINTDKPNQAENIVASLQSKLDTASTYDVMLWEDLMVDLLQTRKLKEAGSKIVPIILYLIIAFVIFGTILMMLKEREYEFGVMNAIGMKRWKLGVMISLETLIINALGVLVGVIFALPIVYYFYKNPIPMSIMGEEAKSTYDDFGVPAEIPFSFDLDIFWNEAVTIFILSIFLSLFIFRKINKLKAIEAMRH